MRGNCLLPILYLSCCCCRACLLSSCCCVSLNQAALTLLLFGKAVIYLWMLFALRLNLSILCYLCISSIRQQQQQLQKRLRSIECHERTINLLYNGICVCVCVGALVRMHMLVFTYILRWQLVVIDFALERHFLLAVAPLFRFGNF